MKFFILLVMMLTLVSCGGNARLDGILLSGISGVANSDATMGSEVGSVTITGSQCTLTSYSLEDDKNGYFKVSSEGKILLAKDNPPAGTYDLVVIGTCDNQISKVAVKIVIKEIIAASPEELYLKGKFALSSHAGYAVITFQGDVLTWGYGVQSIANPGVKVEKIYSNNTGGYAALYEDGSVRVVGRPTYGGDASAVQSQLINVKKIFSTNGAFAALREDGSVITWGTASRGGDSSSVAASLTSGVVSMANNNNAFAALKSDGTVVTWGQSGYGGDSSSVSLQLNSIQEIHSDYYSFSALKSDGSVVCWGDVSSCTAETGIVKIIAGHDSFSEDPSGSISQRGYIGIKSDGTVTAWGGLELNIASVSSELYNIKQILIKFGGAVAALREDGKLITWGNSSYGGDSSSVSGMISTGVKKVFANYRSFGVVKDDDSFFYWNDPGLTPGDTCVGGRFLNGDVLDVVPSGHGYAFLMKDKKAESCTSYQSFSSDDTGLGTSHFGSDNQNIVKVIGNSTSHIAIKENGDLLYWGSSINGGQTLEPPTGTNLFQ